MLKRLNRERMEEVVKMNQEIGSSVFVFEGIKNDLFSPTKYSIASLSPDHIEFDTVNEIVNIKFELRQMELRDILDSTKKIIACIANMDN